MAAVLALVGGTLASAPASSSAASPTPLTVRATASPRSGATVDPGAAITYTLYVQARQPLPAGATVVDDLSGLLDKASVTTPNADLAKQGLTLRAKTKKLTWKVPPLGVRGRSSLGARTSFRATVAADAPHGTKLTTAAFPQDGTCSAGQPCATTLTVAATPRSPPKTTPPATTPPATRPPPSTTPPPTSVASGTTTPPATTTAPPTTTAAPSTTPPPASVPSGTTTPPGTPTARPTTTPPPSTTPPPTSVASGTTTPPGTTTAPPTTTPPPSTTPPPTSVASGTTTPPSTKPKSTAGRRTPAAPRPAQVDCTEAQSADATVVAGFEIDGNLCLNTNPPNNGSQDWETVGGQPVQVDGFNDNTAFTGGASETGTNGWPWSLSQTQGHNPTTNTDVNDVFALTQTVSDQVIAYFGWDRFASTGSAGFYVELNQNPNRFGPVPDRADGDLRLGFTQTGNTLLALTNAATWVSTGPNSGTWDPIPTTGYAAATNPSQVSNLPGGMPNPLPASQFGEVGVNLSELFSAAHECSGAFSTINLRSVPSVGSGTSSLQDWVNPVSLNIPPTCASVVVDKEWNINGRMFRNRGMPPGFNATLTLTDPTGTRTGLQFGHDYGQRFDGTDFEQGDPITIGEDVTVPQGCTNDSGGDLGPQTLQNVGINHFTVTNTVTCTRLTLRKEVVGGDATPDQWTLTAAGPTPVSGPGNSPAVTNQTVAPGDYTLSESGGPSGYLQTSLTCTGGTLVGDTVTVTLHANVVCTFTNTATQRLILQKTWINGATGDEADLEISGTNPPIEPPVTATSTANGAPGSFTDTANQAITTVQSGQNIDLSETLPGANTGTYGSTLECDHDIISPPVGGRTGSFTVPAALAAGTDITCTFTNTRHRATLHLQKRWINGAAGDQAHLTITGTNPTVGPVTATSTADGRARPFTDRAHRATTTVHSGQTITLSEVLSHQGRYDSTLTCNHGITPGPDGSFVIPGDVTPETTIVCTFTNTRHQATLTLRKEWINGADGDTAHLTISGESPTVSGSATSTANGSAGSFLDTDHQAEATVFGGQTITVTETLSHPGRYDATLECTNGTTATGTSGSFTLPAAPDDVTCTFTNDRHQATLILQKTWVNGAEGDTAHLTISGESPPTNAAVTSTATGQPGSFTDPNHATTPVFSGQTITVSESLGSDNTATYDTTLSCDHGVLSLRRNTDGSFTIPDDLTGMTITCTFTNDRHQATLVLQKTWVNGADGDQAHLEITGTNPPILPPGTATSTATGADGSFTDTDHQATAPVHSGQTVTVTETLSHPGRYDTSLACDHDITPGQDGSFTVPGNLPTGTTITCTFTNDRHQATLILQKTWVNGANGDTAHLTISGESPHVSGSATSTANGESGSFTDPDNATTQVFAGQTITVSEALGADNTGSYDSALECTNGITATGTSGSFTLPAAPEAVTCTFTNTRHQATLILQKRWINGADGDSAHLTISGEDPTISETATSTANGQAGEFTDTGHVASTPIHSGQRITVSEQLDATNTSSYDSSLDCPGVDLSQETDTSGSFTVPPGQPSTTIACTFTNDRRHATLTLQKRWINGADGDTAHLTISGESPPVSGSATSTATGMPGEFTDTENQATAAIFSGQEITVAEALGETNAATYTTTVACGNGITVDPNGSLTVSASPEDVTCTVTNEAVATPSPTTPPTTPCETTPPPTTAPPTTAPTTPPTTTPPTTTPPTSPTTTPPTTTPPTTTAPTTPTTPVPPTTTPCAPAPSPTFVPGVGLTGDTGTSGGPSLAAVLGMAAAAGLLLACAAGVALPRTKLAVHRGQNR